MILEDLAEEKEALAKELKHSQYLQEYKYSVPEVWQKRITRFEQFSEDNIEEHKIRIEAVEELLQIDPEEVKNEPTTGI